jgi:hypothetical protein
MGLLTSDFADVHFCAFENLFVFCLGVGVGEGEERQEYGQTVFHAESFLRAKRLA